MDAKKYILSEIKRNGSVTTRGLAAALKISRAYIHSILQELRQEGRVALIGKTRQAYYVSAEEPKGLRAAQKKIRHITLRVTNKDLSEDQLFARVEKETGIFIDIPENVRKLVQHGFTEMVNNAIDHSRSDRINIDCRRSETAITFVVRDYGIGIFKNVQRKFRLPGTLAAVQEILKGKTTTDPKNHSGQGVFFSSKMADIFVIDSFEKQLTINNLLPDLFIVDRNPLKGTRVSFSVHTTSKRTTKGVFDEFTGDEDADFAFDKTRVTIKLFQYGKDLPSRSEAKRVTTNLEHFREVELDFTGVESVGQAFTDEIFRVWQNRHHDVRLIATNVNENVAFMVKRAGGTIGQDRLMI